jgi:thermitase
VRVVACPEKVQPPGKESTAAARSARRRPPFVSRGNTAVRPIRLAVLALFTGGALAACADQSEPLGPGDAAPPFAASFDLTPGDPIPAFVPGEVLVRFTPGAARNEIAQQNRARPKEETRLQRLWILEVAEGEELEIANNLRMNPNVEFAEPNHVYQVVPCETGDCTLPNDPNFGAKWDLHNTGYVTDAAGNVVATTGEAGADIAWLEAFEYLNNSGATYSNTVVGIIDTGIRATHQDMAGRVLAGRNYCPSFFCLIGTVNPNAWADDNGHGTHVAGIVGAAGNNGVGLSGVAWMDEIKFLAVKVCGGPLGLCNAAGITNGIIWAVDNGAHVLNLSLGGGAPSAATQNALQYALNNNVLPVCATGNDGANTVSYPAAFPECMAVASSNWSDERSSYSNGGPEVEVSAPGGDLSDSQPHSLILSSWHTGDAAYAYAAGTSMATPQVAGLAALLRASGMTSMADVRARIRETADDRGPEGFDIGHGHGRINVYRALTGMDPAIEFTISGRISVNPNANGNMQVVLYGHEAVTYALSDIQIATITLGGVPVALRQNGQPFAVWSDVDGDGTMDLVLHFGIPALRAAGAIPAGATELTLRASLDDGRRLIATTPIEVR